MTSIENSNRVEYLNNLNSHLNTRYAREEKQKDLTQAIKYNQEVVDLTSVENFDRAGCLNNLNNHLSTRYEREGKQKDLTQAIEYSQEAVDLTSVGNPDRAGCLNNLSSHLSTRYEREGKQEDLTQAIEYSQTACKCLSSSPSQRLRGCQNAVNFLAHSQRWFEARETVDHGLEILPLLISNLSSKLDQENMMESVSGIAAMGCAVLLECNNEGYDAIRMLEMGRGTINRPTINSRADTSTLFRVHPDLAKRFEDLRSLINVPTEDEASISNTPRPKESVVSELKELISKIRTKVGFEDFQSLPSKHKLFDTLPNQATVLLNTTHFRTDALLIHSDKRIQILPLDQSIFRCSKDNYGSMCDRSGYNSHRNWNRSNKDMQSFLKWLWDQIVGPILHAFNLEPLKFLSKYELPDDLLKRICLLQQRQADLSKGLDANKLATYQNLMQQHPNITSSSGHFQARPRAQTGTAVPKFPRIHWIGVGHLGAFPFHAAGYGSQDSGKNTMSCAISSYASSLTSRAYAKRKPILLEPSSCALLLITMPKTPNQPDLPGVGREATVIQNTIEGLMAVKLCELVPMKVVLDDLPCYNAVHFACHGYADPQSPFQSGLLLCGDEPEKGFDENIQNSILTVETVSSINTERSQLAFLSACCTAENASVVLMDEGIHLAGGFQLAGYPHVIASLWEADDDLSVAVAEKFYQILFAESNIVGHEKIAYALHDATLAARRICDDPLSWATTIHFGP